MTLEREIQNTGDLKRWLQVALAEPGMLPPLPASSPIALMKEGAPEDDDFPNTPGDGVLALDVAGPTLYVRVGGEWKAL